ncbi:hypothetical protein GCM10007853_04250 [Algimonas ampicilliniresistens]|uniref:Uncharacterized protein n=2 Tax=Algimonas ampicilliniresistens TaxID=1298735 RepID=A0ABQ5V7I7_9PROT|nr:hypothetical protein GCM10007853_04250 [Algimonas ampicilliniresistens]
MPDLYTLTAPKLYGIIHRVMTDDEKSSHVLSEVYRHIWKTRYEFSVKPTMNDLVALAQRFALDYKLAGECITRADAPKNDSSRERSLDPSDLSASELDLLSQIYSASIANDDQHSREPLTSQALQARLVDLIPNGTKS